MAGPPLPDLSIRQLEYLAAVADAPSWAAAADGLGVTPSALSQGLAELERRLGIAVFERVGRRRTLRPEAAPVLDHARRVLGLTDDLARWAGRARSGRTGTLRLGMIDASAVGHHKEALRTFRDRHPDVELRLTVAPSGPLLDALRRAEIDLAVCVAPPDHPDDLVVEEVVTDELAVYAPPAVDAGRVPAASWGPWVLFPDDSHTRRLVDEALASLGVPMRVVAESHQPEVLAEMVRLGVGWTVLPRIQAERGPEPLVAARRRPVARRTIAAARRRSVVGDPLADRLVAALREVSP